MSLESTKIILTGGSTYNKYIEAVEMKKYLVSNGISEEAILLETRAKSTYDNALYVAELLKDIKMERLTIITSRCHKARVRIIFQHYFDHFVILVPKWAPIYFIRNIHIYLWEIYLTIKLMLKGDKRLDRSVENNINKAL
jgi:hypothetical protein